MQLGQLSHQIGLALQGLLRNRVQAGLAMLGMMVGVAALVTSLALGRGAQDALDDQLRAAGANLLMVTAGNYDVRTGPAIGESEATNHDAPTPGSDEGSDEPAATPAPGAGSISAFPSNEVAFSTFGHEAFDSFADSADSAPLLEVAPPALTNAVYWGDPADGLFTQIHFENDPFAVHNHPTAAQRLGDSMAGLGSAATLTRDDAAAIAQLDGVQYVVSGVHENARLQVEGSDTEWFTRMHATEADLPQIRTGWTMAEGRFLEKRDVDDNRRVVVLGRVASDRLFGDEADPVGETVVLWNQQFEVVGVVGSTSWAVQPAPGDDQFDAFYVPISTVHELLNLSNLNSIAVTAQSADQVTPLAEAITELLRERHSIGEADPDDFRVQSVAQQVLGGGLAPSVARVVSGNMAQVDEMTVANLSASLKRTNRTIVSLLGGVAAVSLLVGGIGVMNLLLLTVTQRTREVGLRIALGARPEDISRQFLLEAVLLSLVGGVAGILIGVAVSGTLEQFFNWSAAISPIVAIVAVVVAMLIGAVFGVYPASRAAKLSPIEALRHE